MKRTLLLIYLLLQLAISTFGQNNLNTTLISHYGSGHATTTDIKENLLFLNLEDVIKIFDISNVLNPLRVGEIFVDSETFKIDGNYIFVGTRYDGFNIYNISDISNIKQIFSSDEEGIFYHQLIDVDINNFKAYILFEGDSLSILDVSDLRNIFEINRFELEGLNNFGVAVQDDIAYLIRGSTGTSIYNIKNILTPDLITTMLPLRHHDYDFATVTNVIFRDDYAIITHRNNGLLLLDINNPEVPAIVDSFFSITPPFGFNNYGAKFFGDTLCLSNGGYDVVMIDYSDILNPQIISSYEVYEDDLSVYNTELFNGYLIFNGTHIVQRINNWNYNIIWEYLTFHTADYVQYFNDHLYIADHYNGLFIINISNPNQPRLIKLVDATGINFKIHNEKLFLAQGNAGLKVIDISIPGSVEIIGEYNEPLNFIEVRNDTLFCVDQILNKIFILDASDVNNIILLNSVVFDDYIGNLNLKDQYIYLGTQNLGLIVIDISNLSSPQIVNTIANLISIKNIEIRGNRLFVADNNHGLSIFDISNPLNITSIAVLDLGAGIINIHIQNNYLYATTTYPQKGVTIVDIGNLYMPVITGFFSVYDGNMRNVYSNNDLFFFTNSWNGLYIVKNELITPVHVSDEINSPSSDMLHQNFPNPFNPSSKITFSLSEQKIISLKVYDITGSEIITLYEGAMNAGHYEMNFDGSQLPIGVYIYSLQSVDFLYSRKMLLIK